MTREKRDDALGIAFLFFSSRPLAKSERAADFPFFFAPSSLRCGRRNGTKACCASIPPYRLGQAKRSSHRRRGREGGELQEQIARSNADFEARSFHERASGAERVSAREHFFFLSHASGERSVRPFSNGRKLARSEVKNKTISSAEQRSVRSTSSFHDSGSATGFNHYLS